MLTHSKRAGQAHDRVSGTYTLSVHLYQESEGLAPHEALVSTVTNFVARFAITATFVVLVAALSSPWLVPVAIVWGLGVLGALTVSLARQRHASVGRELVRHFAITLVVIVLSRAIGLVVSAQLG